MKYDPTKNAAGSRSKTAAAEEKAPPTAAETATPALCVIEAPMHLGQGYAQDWVDFHGMTRRQRAALKRLGQSLADVNARVAFNGVGYKSGRVVNNSGDAVRYLLDRLADDYEADGRDITEGIEF